MKLFPTIPVMNEPDLEKTLQSLINQTIIPDKIYVCVNQPENKQSKGYEWCNYEEAYTTNQATLHFLQSFTERTSIKIHVIDKSSIGFGLVESHIGVGWARKILMDEVCKNANDEDIIFSCDADTIYPPNYLQETKNIFLNTNVNAVSNNYYHNLTGNKQIDYAILRYEIYMRFYFLNMQRINVPYLFTAIGSAIALSVKSYRAIGGLSPKSSGEDFYLLQQLAKTGIVYNNFNTCVYPSSRESKRVFFGTGPAIINGINNRFTYTIYTPKEWDKIQIIYSAIDKSVAMPESPENIIDCLTNLNASVFPEKILRKFLQNAKTGNQFKKFCIEYFDGLKILQTLRKNVVEQRNPQQDIVDNMVMFNINIPDFDIENIDDLLLLRDLLVQYQRN